MCPHCVAYRGAAGRQAYSSLMAQPTDMLDVATCKFIRTYAARWRAKSIFQVLLQYRAARYHDLFNLSQQVHFFNQQAVHALEQCNEGVDLELVDTRGTLESWLGDVKPSVLKLPFNLADVPFFDTSSMCDPLSNVGAAMDQDEEWDAPFQRQEDPSIKIAIALQKTKLNATTVKPPSTTPLKRRVETLPNLTYSRDPDAPIEHLPKKSAESSCPVPSPIGKLKPSQVINGRSGVNPIAELRTIGRTNTIDAGCDNGDDPPFNFQAMLRKTNIQRGSMKRNEQQHLSSQNLKNVVADDSRMKSMREQRLHRQKLQLAPGIYMEGQVADL